MARYETGSRSKADFNDDTLSTIRVMVDESRNSRGKALPEAPAKSPLQVKTARQEDGSEMIMLVDPSAKKSQRYTVEEAVPPGKSWLKSYRPKVAHVTIAALLVLVLFRPWLMVGLAVTALFLLIVSLLILGYDGFWKSVMSVSRWYASKRPSEAGEMHARLERFAAKWDAFLDNFPDGTVDGLYMPEFENFTHRDERHDAMMAQRLKSLGDS